MTRSLTTTPLTQHPLTERPLARCAAFTRVLLGALALLAVPASSYAQESAPDTTTRHVQIELVAEQPTISAGETVYVALSQTIEDGWHTYWRNPGDSGEPPRLRWAMPDGFAVGQTLWPVPEKILTGPLGSYGYEHEAAPLIPMTAPAALPEGPLTLTADIEILVCADICIPEYSTHSIIFNDPAATAATDHSPLFVHARATLPIESGIHATYAAETTTEGGTDFVLTIAPTLAAAEDILPRDRELTLYPYEWGLVENAAAATTTLTEDGSLMIRQQRGDRALAALNVLNFVVAYKDDNGVAKGVHLQAMPHAPLGSLAAEETGTTAQETGLQNDSITTAAVADTAAPGTPAAASPDNVPDSLLNVSLGQALLFALLGGLILNLMPCVFPVLSIKALKLCRMSGKELAHARLHSVFYTLGILVSFAAFAIAILALQAVGAQIGWGFHLQNPVAVLLLAYLLFLIGLNLSGYIEVSGRLANVGQRLTDGNGYTASFFTGVLAALVATPCTAPFMGVAMGFALTQPAAVTLAVFLTLGFGLALPYILIAAIPALRNLLPRPGAWMETFRQALAFPLFASAAWLFWVYTLQDGSLNVLLALSGALALTFAFWLFKHVPQGFAGRVFVLALAFLALLFTLVPVVLTALSGPAAAPAVTAPQVPVSQRADHWLPFDKADFAQRLAGDDPLFVNMTAAWCITCKVNERIALDVPATQALFTHHNVTAIKGDWTNRNADITAYLAGYGRNGVPLYVYYGPRDAATGERPDPVILPQILTPGMIANTLNPAKGDDKS